MSSAVFLHRPSSPLTDQEWSALIQSEALEEHAPNLTKAGILYKGEVQVQRWESTVVVGTYWMGDLDAVARVALSIASKFLPDRIEANPELEGRVSKGAQEAALITQMIFDTLRSHRCGSK